MAKEKGKKLSGIGGWLIVWIIYSSLVILFQILEIFSVFNFFLLVAIISGAVSYYNLVGKKVSFAKSTRYFLDFCILSQIFVTELFNSTYTLVVMNGDPLMNLSYILGGLIPIGINIAWIYYLKKSERVKNTFVN